MLKIKLRPCVDRGCSLGDGAIGAACRILRVDIGWPRLQYTWSEHCCDSRRIPSLFQSDHATFNKYEYTLNTSRCIPTSADLILKTHHDRYKQITFPRITSCNIIASSIYLRTMDQMYQMDQMDHHRHHQERDRHTRLITTWKITTWQTKKCYNKKVSLYPEDPIFLCTRARDLWQTPRDRPLYGF